MSRMVNFDSANFILSVGIATAVAVSLIAIAIADPAWLHVVQDKWQHFILLTTLFIAFAVSQYRHSWKSKAYWIFLVIWLAIHAAAGGLALRFVSDGPTTPAYVLIAGVEGILFGCSIYWLLRIPPSLTILDRR